MSSLRRCIPCDTYHWSSEDCFPLWDVWLPEGGGTREDRTPLRAQTARKAAERFAREIDADLDYEILDGQGIVICVAACGEDAVKEFEVSGESVVSYHAVER